MEERIVKLADLYIQRIVATIIALIFLLGTIIEWSIILEFKSLSFLTTKAMIAGSIIWVAITSFIFIDILSNQQSEFRFWHVILVIFITTISIIGIFFSQLQLVALLLDALIFTLFFFTALYSFPKMWKPVN